MPEPIIREYIATRMQGMKNEIKLWVLAGVLANMIPAIPAVFFLGGIYNAQTQQLAVVNQQKEELARRREWMEQRERFFMAAVGWS